MPKTASMSAVIVLSVLLGACTPQQAIIAALTPTGAATTLLGQLKGVDEQNIKRIVELERAGRWDELAGFADKNLEKERSNADWWLVLGYARTQGGDHRAAAKAYGEAVRLEPDSALGWNLLAQSYRATGDSQRAIVVLNNALLALRDAPLTVFLLGESYSDLGRLDQAAAAYRQALATEPKFPAAWFSLARTYALMGRQDDAKEARAKLEKLDPKLAKRLDGGDGAGVAR
jgi:tetratricopeptide (TPR) repeat protein